MGLRDLLMLPFVLFFRLSLAILCLLSVPLSPLNLVCNQLVTDEPHVKFLALALWLLMELRNTFTWFRYVSGRRLLDLFYLVHLVVRLTALPLNAVFNGFIFIWCFYWSLFGTKSRGRSLFKVLCDPRAGMTNRKFTRNVDRSVIRPLSSRFYVYSNYQVQGAFDHLGQ